MFLPAYFLSFSDLLVLTSQLKLNVVFNDLKTYISQLQLTLVVTTQPINKFHQLKMFAKPFPRITKRGVRLRKENSDE